MEDATARRVRDEFGEDFDVAMALMATCDLPTDRHAGDRVIRAILTLSAGDLSRLRHNVEVARVDSRDVLWWAENEPDPHASAAVEMRRALDAVVWANFSRASRAPGSWDDVQAVIDLPVDVIELLGIGGLPSRDELVVRANEAFRARGGLT